ncbi:MAG: riboflavin synthase [Planctomycetes bacterium B3_Pla]|nr:MAG: riboflavin synthase [Planctomycetes bacterium B3_Pla]
MFTGLVETICVVKSIRPSAGSTVLVIDMGELAGESRIGDSISINGVCLTVAGIEGALVSFDVSAETLAKSTLGKLKSGSQVNIERALKAADRFGGHFVQGHVDGTATIAAITKHGEFADIRFAAEAELLDAMVPKGSVAVDGISLTIAKIDQNGFTIAIIPETLRRTTLGKARIGDCVNIETDIIVKTIKRQLENILPKKEPLTAEKLKELGF